MFKKITLLIAIFYCTGTSFAMKANELLNPLEVKTNRFAEFLDPVFFSATTVINGTNSYYSGLLAEVKALSPAPSDHVTSFGPILIGLNHLSFSWFPVISYPEPDGYIIKASSISFESIAPPVDGIEEIEDTDISDGSAVYKRGYRSEFLGISGLTELTTYYFKIYPYTNSGTNILYKTDGDVPQAEVKTLAPAPSDHVTDFGPILIGTDHMSFSWFPVISYPEPDGYIIKASNVSFGSIAAPIDGIEEVEDTDISDGSAVYKTGYRSEFLGIFGLTPSTTYYFKVYPYTNSGINILYKTDGNVPQAQVTTKISYCSSTFLPNNVNINSVSFNTINNTNWGSPLNGYTDYSSISTDIHIGSTYELSVSANPMEGPVYIRAWIDWNHNGEFTDPGEAYDIGGGETIDGIYNVGDYSTLIQVPLNAQSSAIRMRISSQLGAYRSSPCGSAHFGETEDYTLNILPACTPPASQATDLVISNVDQNSLSLNWTSGSQEIIVIAKEGGMISDDPLSGISYTANSAYGTAGTELSDGFVVFNGVGETVTVTGYCKKQTITLEFIPITQLKTVLTL